tara:strand:+ start:609 stop:1214 length:606 start_codon:yes stop_codon:yes gene_type:complete
MCEPMTILAIAGSAMASMQANKAANAQSAYQTQLSEANEKQANEAAVRDYQQSNTEQTQAGESALQQKMANDLRARELTSTANVAGAQSGAIDNTGAVGSQYIRQGLEANTGVSQNLGRGESVFDLQRQGIRANQYSRIQSVSKGQGKVSSFSGADLFQAGVAGAGAHHAGGGKFGMGKGTPTTPKPPVPQHTPVTPFSGF